MTKGIQVKSNNRKGKIKQKIWSSETQGEEIGNKYVPGISKEISLPHVTDFPVSMTRKDEI